MRRKKVKVTVRVKRDNLSANTSVLAVPMPTPTATISPLPREDAFQTVQPMPTEKPTATARPTAEATETPIPTVQPTATARPTPEATETPIPTVQPTATARPTPEPTVIPQEKCNHEFTSEILQEATCEEEGVEYCTCLHCGKNYTKIVSKQNHVPTESYVLDKAATCNEVGIESKHCTVCGVSIETTEQIIVALGHEFDSSFVVDREATCTKNGSKSRHCLRCGTMTAVTTIEAKGHVYTEDYEIVQAATCTEYGKKQRQCENCEYYDTAIINKLGHSYESVMTVDKEATCTESGCKSHHCSRCSATVGRTEIDALGHTWGSWELYADATCEEEGSERRECTRCKEAQFRATGKIEHGFSKLLGARLNVDGSLTYEAVCPNGSHASHHNYSYTVPDYDIIQENASEFRLSYFEAFGFMLITGITANDSSAITSTAIINWLTTYFPSVEVWLVDNGNFYGINKGTFIRELISANWNAGILF